MTPMTVTQMNAISINPDAISKVVAKIGELAPLYAEINRLAFQALNDLDEEGMTYAERDIVRQCLQREFNEINPAVWIAAF